MPRRILPFFKYKISVIFAKIYTKRETFLEENVSILDLYRSIFLKIGKKEIGEKNYRKIEKIPIS